MAFERNSDDDPQRNANTRTRPIRIAFLVELSEASQAILTAIFQACFRFWGGRFSLIVPCQNGVPLAAFRAWLKAYDPDVIYSYVDLSDADQVKLHEDLYPAYLIRHRDPRDDERADIRGWSPALPITPLGISTLLPLLARRSAFGPPTSLKLAIALGQAQDSRFLLDCFGTHDLAVERRATNELVGQMEVVAVAGDDVDLAHHRQVHERLQDERELLRRLGGRQNFTTLAQLSAILTPRADMRDYNWAHSFNLLIGDTVGDRLLYWNTRSLFAVWRDGSPVDLRVPTGMMADENFRAALLAYLRGIPSVGSDNSGGMYVTLRSASLTAEELSAFQEALTAPKQWIGWRVEAISGPENYVPKQFEDNGWLYGISQAGGLSTGRWNSQFVTAGRWHLTGEIPDHLRHAPITFQSESEGLWAVDMDVERGADNSPYDNVRDRWRLPRRLRVTGSFIRSHQLSNPHSPMLVPRVSRHGLLTLFTGGGGTLPVINEPTDHVAIIGALAQGRDWLPFARYDAPRPEQLCYGAGRSDAGRYFWGVYQLFGGLDLANGFLMHKFWRAQLAKFGATDQRPEQRLEQVKNTLRKNRRDTPLDMAADQDVARLADIVVREADALRLSNPSISWDELRADHEKIVQEDWRQTGGGKPEDRDDALEWDRRSLSQAVQSLCSRGVLHQGHEFACPRCHHHSWIGIDDLQKLIVCEVCKFSESAPVDRAWDFRLNGFLREALRRHGVGPLFWALSKLRPVPNGSYWFEGPLGIYLTREAFDRERFDTDIDLTVVAGDQVRMCEVKQSVRGFSNPEAYASTFARLRPDVATIAIMEPLSPKIQAAFAKFKSALEGTGIAAELMTFDPEQDVEDRAYLADLRRVRVF